MKQMLTTLKSTPKFKASFAAAIVAAVAVGGIFVLWSTLAAPLVTTTKSGNWSDASVWSTNQVPQPTEEAVIASGHTVTYDLADSQVSGLSVNPDASLTFAPDTTTTLETDRNAIIEGELIMKPSSPAINHTLRFINVDEEAFVGGGMDPIESDVGLWVVGAGQLDINGTPKKSWTNATGSIAQGATSITVNDATGWRAGDEISIAPTENPGVGNRSWNGFHETSIQSISGNTITLANATAHPHPEVNNKWTAEVMNLTRNVRIEGTGNGETSSETNGRTHILIRSTQPQTVKHAAIRHTGPRQDTGDSYIGDCENRCPIFEDITGRYALHWHHSGDGARGSMVDGVVTRDRGSKGFVPHASHGVTVQNSIAYNGWSGGFWWDPPPKDTKGNTPEDQVNDSHDILWDTNIVAIVKADPAFRGFSGTDGYTLNVGDNTVLRNSVAVGVRGNNTSGGFHWPSRANHRTNNVWVFEDNIAHNNKADGIFVWQNDTHAHLINRFLAYHNGEEGIHHGAYRNSYRYLDIELFGNTHGIGQHALPVGDIRPDGYRMAFENINSNTSLVMARHNLASDTPILYRNCTFPKVIVDEAENFGMYDFVNCNLEPADFDIVTALPDMLIRVQRADRTAYQIDHTGQVSTIQPFYDHQAPDPEDTTPPTVTLTNPTDGSTVSGTADVTADASDDTGVTKVEFYQGSTLIGSDTSAPYSQSWDTTAVTNGSYTLTAKAFDAANNTAKSSVANVTVSNTTEDTEPPTAPTGLTATATRSNQVNLAWDASTDNVGVTGYNVYRNDSGLSPIARVSGSITSYSDAYASPDTTYSYRVTAFDAADNTSEFSNEATATTPAEADTTAPTAPSDLTADATKAGQVDLDWTASTDNAGVTGYYVYRDGAVIATTTNTAHSDTTVDAATTYDYYVKAFDAAGNISSASNTESVTTASPAETDTTPPTAPSDLRVTAKHVNYINLAWNASTDDTGVTNYDIYRDGTRIATVPGSTTTFGDGTVSPNTTYSYHVIARDAAGNSSLKSNTVSAFSHHRKNR